MDIERLITELENLKTFSFKRYDKEGKVCVDKVGVDIKDLQNIINQFKKSLIDYRVVGTVKITQYEKYNLFKQVTNTNMINNIFNEQIEYRKNMVKYFQEKLAKCIKEEKLYMQLIEISKKQIDALEEQPQNSHRAIQKNLEN